MADLSPKTPQDFLKTPIRAKPDRDAFIQDFVMTFPDHNAELSQKYANQNPLMKENIAERRVRYDKQLKGYALARLPAPLGQGLAVDSPKVEEIISGISQSLRGELLSLRGLLEQDPVSGQHGVDQIREQLEANFRNTASLHNVDLSEQAQLR